MMYPVLIGEQPDQSDSDYRLVFSFDGKGLSLKKAYSLVYEVRSRLRIGETIQFDDLCKILMVDFKESFKGVDMSSFEYAGVNNINLRRIE